MKNVFLAFALLGFVACAGKGGDSQANQNDSQLNGKTPEQYYEQFIRFAEPNCKSTEIRMRILQVDSTQIESYGNDPVFAELSLSIDHNGNYRTEYSEKRKLASSDMATLNEVLYTKHLSGKWFINEKAELVLEGLGTAFAFNYKNKDALRLTYVDDIGRRGLKGRVVLVELSYRSLGSNAEVCGKGAL